MSLVYPLDILDSFPGWVTAFELKWRQELSRTAGGLTLAKDLGSPLWTLTARSRTLSPNLLDDWRARLDALEGSLQTFRGYSLSRCWPVAAPRGAWPGGFSGTATLATIGADNSSITLSGLPAGFPLKRGDMIRLGDSGLHRLMEDATANGAGITGAFAVRPHLWPGLAAGAAALLTRPWCPMILLPGTLTTEADLNGRGAITFQAIELR